MESKVIFRDFQEQQAADHNDLQAYARKSFDDIVHDAITASRRYSGFFTQKTAQAEVQTAPGRFYDVDGGVYALGTTTVQSMVQYLAATSKRIVTIAAYGVENETDTQERDFLTDADTGATEPRAVATTLSRNAVIAFVQGAESGEPSPPVLAATQVRIADVLVDTIQVVSVTMFPQNAVTTIEAIDQRVDVTEAFDAMIGPRVSSLASDLADLANRLNQASLRTDMSNIYLDLARVKATLRFPAAASNYGTDFFLDNSLSDITDSFAQGYDCKVEMGLRFSDANANEFEISLFSANDQNAQVINGVLLPKHTDEVKFQTGAYSSDLGIAQYGYQTVTMKQGYLSRSRLRYGSSYAVCSNSAMWNTGGTNAVPSSVENLYDFGTTEFTAVSAINWIFDGSTFQHEYYYAQNYWYDTWKEPYMYAVTTDHVLTGAFVWQSWLQSNDIWMTKLGIYITVKAAAEDIHLAVCELVAGVPDLSKTIMTITLAAADIVIGWNRIATPYTFLRRGSRYAVVALSNANHRIGIADGQGFLNGTFGYSTDGAYFQGDLTKDMMLEVWGARFNAAQVQIEFAPINLDGGFRDVDILAEMWVPDSCQLLWEMRPSGVGDWQPLLVDNAAVLATAPPLAQFRGRFVGTTDMAPALHLTGSRVHVSRPKVANKHVSTDITLATPSAAIHVIVTLENFDETPHDHTCILKTGTTHTVTETADTTVTTLLDLAAKRYKREYTFNLAGGAVTHFIIIETGATTSSQNLFHVAERDFYSL